MTTEINNMPSGGGDSSASTVLMAVVIILLIGLAVWFFGFRGSRGAAPSGGGTNINVTLPAGGDSSTAGGAAQ